MSVAAQRPVPNLSGETRAGDTVTVVAVDTKRVAQFAVTSEQRLVKLSVLCDGAGGAAPSLRALVRGVVYQGDALLGVGSEVVVDSGAPFAWRDLPLLETTREGVSVSAGTIEYGLIVGGDANVLRVAQIDPQSPGGRFNADPYANGPTTVFGSSTPLTANMSIFATSTVPWVPIPSTPVAEMARLGWDDTQELLLSPTLVSPTYVSDVTWHGTSVDANRGAFAIVRSDGPLAGLVGSRIQVTTLGRRPRSALVYVWATVPSLDGDISLSRRAFAAIALLAEDSVEAFIEVLA